MTNTKKTWTPIPDDELVSDVSQLPPMTDEEIAIAVRVIELIRKEQPSKAGS